MGLCNRNPQIKYGGAACSTSISVAQKLPFGEKCGVVNLRSNEGINVRFDKEVQVGKAAPVYNIPLINIYSSRGSSMSDNVAGFVETEDHFKCIGPIGPVQPIKLCESYSIGNSESGGVCITNSGGCSGATCSSRGSRRARGHSSRSGSRCRHCVGCDLLLRSSQQ